MLRLRFRERMVEVGGLLTGLLLTASAWGQTPEVANVFPPRFSAYNSTTTSVVVQFSRAMDGASILPQNFKVYGQHTGYHTGTLSYSASTQSATFQSAAPFQAGEAVTVILTQGIRAGDGTPLQESFQWTFFVRAGTGTAQLHVDSTYTAGDGPHYVGLGELDGSPGLDVAVPHSRSDNVLSWLNSGTGDLTQNNNLLVGDSPRALTLGDFDADGDLDVAVANERSKSVTILDNDGTGGLTARPGTLTTGTEPIFVTTADLDGDGALDLVTVDNGADSLTVFRNQGDGTFAPGVAVAVGDAPQMAFAGDFNNDGHVDLVVTNGVANNVVLLLNDGNANFGAPTTLAAGTNPRAVHGDDFNGDGWLDVVYSNRGAGTVTVLFNLKDGTFSLPTDFPVGQDPFSIVSADLDGDFDADFAVSNRLSNDIYVLLNNGSGGFTVDGIYATGQQPRGLNLGDLDGDGVVDAAAVNWAEDRLQVFTNPLGAPANHPPEAPALSGPDDLSMADPNSTLTLSWDVPADADGDALHFKIEIDDDPDFSSPVRTFDSSTDATGFTPTPPVAQGTGSVSYSFTPTLADGLYWWRVIASDGQVAGPPSQARRFLLDGTPPVITDVAITAPAFQPNWYNPNTAGNIQFGAVYDEANPDRAEFSLGALGGNVVEPNLTGGTGQVIQTPVTLTGAADGLYPLAVTIFDKAGNQDAINTNIALDGTAPTGATASSPATSNQERFLVSWGGATDGTGSGLSGRYDVRVQVDGGPWQDWLTDFDGTSAEYQGAHGSTYGFEAAARDNVGNVEAFTENAETVTVVDTTNDVTAPGPPVTLTANGANPSPWTNNPVFQIAWQEPPDASGIDRALYKLGSPPVSNFDTTGSVRGQTALNLNVTQEGGLDFYLWFSDQSGNVDFQNRGSVTLRYDGTAPTGTVASSPATSVETTFQVSWGGGTDSGGSGLSGFFDVRVQVNGGAWEDWLTNFQGTSANYDGAHGNTYGFEAVARDVAGNIEAFTNTAETTTLVDTVANDAQAPGPPPVLTAGGSNPSPWQNTPQFQVQWQEPADPSGIARALYKFGSAPTANFDTTATTTATSLQITATREDGEPFYVWFEDERGNLDFRNSGMVLLRYDATAPDIVELGPLNPDFSPNWYNQRTTDQAEIEVNYDEKYLQKIEITSTDLAVSFVEESPPSGIDVFYSFNVDLPGRVDGVYKLFYTLTDSAGNTAEDSTTLALDGTPPTGTRASSPDTSGETSFLVSWDGTGDDGAGSGLSGRYNVRYQENGGPWQDWLTDFNGTSEVFNGEVGKVYGFEAAAIDNVGNAEPFLQVAETTTLVDTAFADTSPPTIFHTQPLVVNQGEDITLSAQVEDNARVTEVLLFYKNSGAVSYDSMPMTNTGGSTYEATLTAAQIGTLGVNYFIRASDGRNFAFHPINNAATVPNNLSVRLVGEDNSGLKRGEPQPSGELAQAYRMFSIPINADDRSPRAVLEDDLGTYDRKKWRLFQYDNRSSSYEEFPNVDQFAPGTALWLIVRDANRFIDTGPGATVVTNQPFEITLQQGWNDIGLPFQFPVNWSDIQVVAGNPDDIMGPYTFEDVWKTPDQVTVLQPWEGYSIFSNAAGVRIAIQPIAAQGSVRAKPATAIDWALTLEVQAGAHLTGLARLGVAAEARPEWDPLDYLEPPHISDYVSVRFPHPDWAGFAGAFLSDFRPAFRDGEIWEFEVRTSLDNPDVRLRLRGLQSLPAEFNAVLYDPETLQQIDLRRQPEYRFRVDAQRSRTFRLLIGTDAFLARSETQLAQVPDEFYLSQNFPNPFNAGTTLVYKLSQPVHVELSVLNLLGQEVKRLVSGKQEPGLYRVQWDGTGLDGRELSSGVYLVRLKAGTFRQTRKVVFVR